MGKKLYRYRTFNSEMINDYSYIHNGVINIEKWKFEAFEGLVFPSSPLYFNDPYDCEFCFQPEVLDCTIERTTYIQLLERKFSLKQDEKNRLLYSDNIERALDIVLQAHGERLSASWKDIILEALSNGMEEIRDAVRVVCLSEVFDSMLMWSHYAQNHTGYCLEYDFSEADMFYKHLYPVVYTKDRYAVSKDEMSNGNTEWIYRSTCRKADVWSYEKEWRIVTANYDKIMAQKQQYTDRKYVLDLRNNVKAFYLGSKSSEEFREEIIRFGKTKRIPVYQMVLSHNSYELKAEKIV